MTNTTKPPARKSRQIQISLQEVHLNRLKSLCRNNGSRPSEEIRRLINFAFQAQTSNQHPTPTTSTTNAHPKPTSPR
jgi:hypothetical protein